MDATQSQTQVQAQIPPQSLPHPTPLHPTQTPPVSQPQAQVQPHTQPPPVHSRRQHSKSTSSGSLSPQTSSPYVGCSWARGVSRPPSVLLPRALYDVITASDVSGLPRCTSFLPHMSVAWASSFRYKMYLSILHSMM